MAYRYGVFPMARSRDSSEVLWIEPNERAIIPLGSLKVSRSTAKLSRRFQVTLDKSFDRVIDLCSSIRQDTWINQPIRDVFCDLHRSGYAHSVEAWRDGALVGGLYGLSIGGAFFGESMFSLESGASKIALMFLEQRLRALGYSLLDCQFPTPHLSSMGAVTVDAAQYRDLLKQALELRPAKLSA